MHHDEVGLRRQLHELEFIKESRQTRTLFGISLHDLPQKRLIFKRSYRGSLRGRVHVKRRPDAVHHLDELFICHTEARTQPRQTIGLGKSTGHQ